MANGACGGMVAAAATLTRGATGFAATTVAAGATRPPGAPRPARPSQPLRRRRDRHRRRSLSRCASLGAGRVFGGMAALLRPPLGLLRVYENPMLRAGERS